MSAKKTDEVANPDASGSVRRQGRPLLRQLVIFALLIGVLAGGFAWGFASHRLRIFPFNLLRSQLIESEFVFGVEKRFRAWKSATARTRFKKGVEDIVTVSPTIEMVQSLPYVAGSTDSNPQNKGVVFYDPAKAWSGLNFYVSQKERQVLLIEMDGSLVHRWTPPGDEPSEATLLPNGDIIILSNGLTRLDKRSEIIWQRDWRVHHAVQPGNHDDLWVIRRESGMVQEISSRHPIGVDHLVRVSLDGEELQDLTLHELILESPYRFLLPKLGDRKIVRDGKLFDVLHTNFVTVFDGSLEQRGEIYKKDNLLVSVRNISTIMVIDPNENRIVWVWGPTNLTLQHNPRILENGNFLVFNNGIVSSRVLEISPVTLDIEWQYGGEALFSDTRGHSQRLPNGNTLITESNRGYAFEVTPAGEVVWQFANPNIDRQGFRYMIDEVDRYDREYLTFLKPTNP